MDHLIDVALPSLLPEFRDMRGMKVALSYVLRAKLSCTLRSDRVMLSRITYPVVAHQVLDELLAAKNDAAVRAVLAKIPKLQHQHGPAFWDKVRAALVKSPLLEQAIKRGEELRKRGNPLAEQALEAS